jgi:myo-inositol-1(or 4)-monophosphatase
MNDGQAPAPALLREIEHTAAELARGAGQRLLSTFRTALAVEYKGAGKADPVTEADRDAERFLRDGVHERFAGHGVLGEEGTEPPHGAEFVWVIDPLDGTTNYINGLPLWCVSVGVLWRNEPVAAAIFTPSGPGAAQTVFHASAGGGASMDGTPIAVTDEPEPTKARLATLPGHYWQDMRFRTRKGERLGETRTLGSIALELALIASGVLQYGVFWSPKIWDVAAGVLLVREAGGDVLTRQRTSEPWARLHAFTAAQPGVANLRGWKGSVIAGCPRVVQVISDDVDARRNLLGVAGPLWKRFRNEC